MKTIPLTQGQVALVDDADYTAVSQFKWCFHKGYACRNIRKPGGKWATQYLHQFLMPGVSEIDHRDGNRLNDQRENIRPATHQQNLQGFQRKKSGTTSRFRGVCWEKRRRKWMAYITVDWKHKFLGYFDFEEDAARARDVASIKYFGEFASLNFKAA